MHVYVHVHVYVLCMCCAVLFPVTGSHTHAHSRPPPRPPHASIPSQAFWDISEYFFEDGVLANENVDEDVRKLCQSCLSKSTKKEN